MLLLWLITIPQATLITSHDGGYLTFWAPVTGSVLGKLTIITVTQIRYSFIRNVLRDWRSDRIWIYNMYAVGLSESYIVDSQYFFCFSLCLLNFALYSRTRLGGSRVLIFPSNHALSLQNENLNEFVYSYCMDGPDTTRLTAKKTWQVNDCRVGTRYNVTQYSSGTP